MCTSVPSQYAAQYSYLGLSDLTVVSPVYVQPGIRFCLVRLEVGPLLTNVLVTSHTPSLQIKEPRVWQGRWGVGD